MSQAETGKNFYIFRHGECPFNLSGHIQGQKFNGRLTNTGRRQAAQIGRALQGKNIDIIICSPMRRTIQTAQIVKGFIGAPILLDKRFIEVNMGVIEGMHYTVAEKKYAQIYRHWRSNKYQDRHTHFEDGESKALVRQRIFEAMNYYAENSPFQNIAVSGHGIILSQILLYFNIKRSDIPNGAILHLSYQNHQWKFEDLIEI